MEYVGSYVFNRGQEITLRRGPKSYWVAVQLFNSTGSPFRYLKDTDRERILYRAMAMVAKDVAKDGQDLVLREQEGPPLPFKVKTEDEEIQAFALEFREEHPELWRSWQDKIKLGVLEKLPAHVVKETSIERN